MRCVPCYIRWKNSDEGKKKAKPRRETRVVTKVAPDLDGKWLRKNLRVLINLCHPDVHVDSEKRRALAHEVTQYLNERRDAIKRGEEQLP